MEHRHLWLRSLRQKSILRIRHRIIKSVRDFFDNKGFTLVDAPIFTPNACEGTTNLFKVDYFDQNAYLTQSGQLYMEAAAMAVGKSILLRSYIPCGKIKDKTPLNRVLDGRAGSCFL